MHTSISDTFSGTHSFTGRSGSFGTHGFAGSGFGAPDQGWNGRTALGDSF